MKTNTQLKNDSLAALKGNWGKAVLATVVYVLLACLVSGPVMYTSAQMEAYAQDNIAYGQSVRSITALMTDPAYMLLRSHNNMASCFTTLIEVFLLLPLSVGYANALRRLLVTGENDVLGNTFHIGFSNYWHKVWGMLLMGIFIALWSLLLVIPGIIKSFSYAMTPYILEENPELSANEAIDRSRAMMRGHKFDLFWLFLSFLGWGILCLFTLGIGFLWLAPYMETAQAAFYEEVKADYAQNGGLI